MADFSIPTLFVVPSGSTFATTGSTQDLTAGKVGFFGEITSTPYTALTAANIATPPHFIIAQGRASANFQGSKKSDKIKGCFAANCTSNVTEAWYDSGNLTPINQITTVGNFRVRCNDTVSLTINAHSYYLDTLNAMGLTKSVTVKAPCCDCGEECEEIDDAAMVTLLVDALNADRQLSEVLTFTNNGTYLTITGKALTAEGAVCDISANPHQFDRMHFRTFVYVGQATAVDSLDEIPCEEGADVTITQTSSYTRFLSAEIAQLEKDYHSYQTGVMKQLSNDSTYNQTYESYVAPGVAYDLFYIKTNPIDKGAYNFGDFVGIEQMMILAVVKGSAEATALLAILTAALGSQLKNVAAVNATTTTTTSTTSTTTTTIP